MSDISRIFVGRKVHIEVQVLPNEEDQELSRIGVCLAIGPEGIAIDRDGIMLLVPWGRIEDVLLMTG
jgi:hypothetical protein